MPVYEFTALDAAGKSVRGIIDADSPAAARQKIRSQGSYPISVEAARARTRLKARDLVPGFLGGRSGGPELHLLTRQLATMLGAGIPLVPALNSLIEQGGQGGLQTVLAQIRRAVNEGLPLSGALAAHPRLFSPMYINMVRAGEASGTLHLVLEQLAEFGERQQALHARIRAAMLYPVFMAVVGVAVLALLIVFILPGITAVFEGNERALPLPTTLLMGMSAFLRAYWLPLLALLLMAAAATHQALRRPEGQRRWHRLKLSLPLLAGLNRRQAAARFARSLANLLQAGVPLVDALRIVSNIVGNVLIGEAIENACAELEKGRGLADYFRERACFPPMLVQMMAVGEQSGALDTMLARAADSYERELETRIMGLTAMIEPVMILLMGVAVAAIVMAVLLPIFEMNQLIR